MKNKKLLFHILLPSLLMIGFGAKTIVKYQDTPGDWHFIVALMSTSVFVLFAYAAVRKFNKVQKVQECDATEAK